MRFFGLPVEYKYQLHDQIFQLTFNSKGSISFTEAYYMPVYLRRWYLQRMEKAYKDENEAISKARKKSSDPRLSKLKK